MKKIVILLLAFCLLFPAACIGAEEEFDVTGAWYGYDMDGQPYTFWIEADGSCAMKKDGFDRIYDGRWTNSGRLLTLKFKSEKFDLVSEGDHLILDSRGSMLAYDDSLFTHEPFEPFSAVINKDAPREAYEGTWKLAYTYHYKKPYQTLYDDRHKAWYETPGIILYYDHTEYVIIHGDELCWADTNMTKISPPNYMTWKKRFYECPTIFWNCKISILENGNLYVDNQDYEAYVFIRDSGT